MEIIVICVFIIMCLAFLVVLFKDIVKSHFLHEACQKSLKDAQVTSDIAKALSKQLKELLK